MKRVLLSLIVVGLLFMTIPATAQQVYYGALYNYELPGGANMAPAQNIKTWLGNSHLYFVKTWWNIQNPPGNVKDTLDAAWNAGFVPALNIVAETFTCSDLYIPTRPNHQAFVDAITNFSTQYASWVVIGGGRGAHIAPLYEQNYGWGANCLVDPRYPKCQGVMTATDSQYCWVYIRNAIVTALGNAGATQNTTTYVYHPNIYPDNNTQNGTVFHCSSPDPGSCYADYAPNAFVTPGMVGLSGYNFGTCPNFGPYFDITWDSGGGGPVSGFGYYLGKLAEKLPGLTIEFDTGTVEHLVGNTSIRDKNSWLIDIFSKFPSATNAGIIFNQETHADPFARCPDDWFALHPISVNPQWPNLTDYQGAHDQIVGGHYY